jgi:hypothetical protein
MHLIQDHGFAAGPHLDQGQSIKQPRYLELPMRHLLPLVAFLLLAFASGVAVAAADPLAGLTFADGKARTLDDFKSHSLVLVYFCGS